MKLKVLLPSIDVEGVISWRRETSYDWRHYMKHGYIYYFGPLFMAWVQYMLSNYPDRSVSFGNNKIVAHISKNTITFWSFVIGQLVQELLAS